MVRCEFCQRTVNDGICINPECSSYRVSSTAVTETMIVGTEDDKEKEE